MEHKDWLQRWREGRTGWHQQQVTPLLRRHWAALDVLAGTRVFVPLCGKSLDMAWLVARGTPVLGAELSPLAVREFFAGQGLEPGREQADDGELYTAGDLQIIQGDVFAVNPARLGACNAVYDRAALIALSPPLRRRYVREVYGALPAACTGLLIALEYPEGTLAGPPYSVAEAEVRELFEPGWEVELLERRVSDGPASATPGVARFHAAVYRLQKRTPKRP